MIICALALLLEALIGYPQALFARIGHPVSWIGRALAWADRSFNRERHPDGTRRRNGVLVIAGLVAICAGAAFAIATAAFAALPTVAAVLLVAVLGSSLIAQRSLDAHVRAVADALQRDGIAAGRRAVAMIVGRDVATLDDAGIARAAIESLAENFADGIVAPAFWLALLGLPGGVAYKAVNTADSMIGHRTSRHAAFGWGAARLDDIVNWIPARLAALWLVLAAALVPGARPGAAWRVMRRDADGHPSPNAGWPEAAMAGALGIRLGGPRAYGGTFVPDATMGDGPTAADAATIHAALRLYRVACGLQIACVLLLALLIARW